MMQHNFYKDIQTILNYYKFEHNLDLFDRQYPFNEEEINKQQFNFTICSIFTPFIYTAHQEKHNLNQLELMFSTTIMTLIEQGNKFDDSYLIYVNKPAIKLSITLLTFLLKEKYYNEIDDTKKGYVEDMIKHFYDYNLIPKELLKQLTNE